MDYLAEVWLDGQYLGSHEDGYTPFTFDVTDLTAPGSKHTLTVRAEDRLDCDQPRGKQSFRPEPFAGWYTPVTGIWGYIGAVQDEAAFLKRFEAITQAFKHMPDFSGYCYTRLTDVFQGVNGLLDMERNPKMRVEAIREINLKR